MVYSNCSEFDQQKVESQEYYDKLAKEYHYTESYRRWPWVEYFHIQNRIGGIAQVLERISKKRRIDKAIDIGCGDGVLLPIMSKVAKQVVALEISPKRLQMAKGATKEFTNIRFDVANIMQPSSSYSGKFDLVACSEVIEHVSNYERFFERLVDIVAPGGSLVLTTPSRWSFREKSLRIQQILLDIYFNGILKRDVNKLKFFHIGLMTVKELRRMANKHFSVWDLQTTGLYFPIVTELGFLIGGNRWRQYYKALDKRVGKTSFKWINWTQILVAEK